VTAILIATTVGCLFALGTYLVLRRSWVKVILGISLLGQACNVLLFSLSGLTPGKAPLVGQSASGVVSDPLPHALILTAIVIGFAMQAFLLVLFQKASRANHSGDLDHLEESK
jgi:multicomponent Na+:H+ antiporter subunit C